MKSILLAAALVTLYQGILQADEAVIKLQCSTSGGQVKTKCSFPSETPIVISQKNEDFEVDWAVSYRFDCRGFQTGLRFTAGGAYEKIPYTAGHDSETIVRGRRNLEILDSDPNQTAMASLIGECLLRVKATAFSPSIDTVADWYKEAGYQARILDLSTSLYQLSASFAGYMNWDLAKTTFLHESVQKKLVLFEERCSEGDESACVTKIHFTLVAAALKSKIDQVPTVPMLGDKTLEELSESYKKDLLTEMEKAQAMQEKFKKYGQNKPSSLSDALEKAKGGVS